MRRPGELETGQRWSPIVGGVRLHPTQCSCAVAGHSITGGATARTAPEPAPLQPNQLLDRFNLCEPAITLCIQSNTALAMRPAKATDRRQLVVAIEGPICAIYSATLINLSYILARLDEATLRTQTTPDSAKHGSQKRYPGQQFKHQSAPPFLQQIAAQRACNIFACHESIHLPFDSLEQARR